jgi:hypothetical protein
MEVFESVERCVLPFKDDIEADKMDFNSSCAVVSLYVIPELPEAWLNQTRLKLAAVAPSSKVTVYWTSAAVPRLSSHVGERIQSSAALQHSSAASPEMATVVPMPLPGDLASSPLDSKRNNARVDLSMFPAEVSEAQLSCGHAKPLTLKTTCCCDSLGLFKQSHSGRMPLLMLVDAPLEQKFTRFAESSSTRFAYTSPSPCMLARYPVAVAQGALAAGSGLERHAGRG